MRTQAGPVALLAIVSLSSLVGDRAEAGCWDQDDNILVFGTQEIPPDGSCGAEPVYLRPLIFSMHCSGGTFLAGATCEEQEAAGGGCDKCVNYGGFVVDTCDSTCEPKDQCPADGSGAAEAENASFNHVGDPVDLATGFLEQRAVDVDLGGGVRFERHYSSGLGVETSMGRNWSHNWQWSAVVSEVTWPVTASVVAVTPPGRSPRVFARFGATGPFETHFRRGGSVELSGGLIEYVDDDGTEVVFDSSGQLTSLRETGRAPIAFSVAGTTRTVSNGSATFSFTESGGKVASLSANGETWTYTYESGDLATVTGPDPTTATTADEIVWTYTYTSAGSGLLRHLDRTAQGQTVALGNWSYGAASRVATADESNLDQPLSFAYQVPVGGGLETAVSDADATPEVLATFRSRNGHLYEVVGAGGPGVPAPLASGTTEESPGAVDLQRWHETVDLEGHRTLYEAYVRNGAPGRVVEGWIDADASDSFTAGDGYARITEYTWHPALDRPLTVTRESTFAAMPGSPCSQSVTTFDYDDDGDAEANEAPTPLLRRRIDTGCTMDAGGNIVALTSTGGSGYTTTYGYNAAGQLTSIAGPRPESYTAIEYDGQGRRTAVKRYLAGPGSPFLQTTYSSFDANGNPQSIADSNWVDDPAGPHVTTLTYDGLSRVKTVTPPWTGSGSSTVSFTYTGRSTRSALELRRAPRILHGSRGAASATTASGTQASGPDTDRAAFRGDPRRATGRASANARGPEASYSVFIGHATAPSAW